MPIYSFLAIPIGYLLGSIPSAYIIGRLWGKTDIRTEGDGRISAAAIKKRVGLLPFLLVAAIDVCKGVLAVVIAHLLTNSSVGLINDLSQAPLHMPLASLIIVLATGFVTVMGHCWSLFINFWGGLGASVIYGVLGIMLFFPQELIALVIGGIAVLVTRKSGFSTGVIIVSLSVILLLQKLFLSPDMSPLLIAYPLILILLMVAKRFQLNKTRGAQSHDLLEYWKNNHK